MVGESHWNDAVQYLMDHPDKNFTFVHAFRHGAPLDTFHSIGWEYMVHRNDSVFHLVTYYDGIIYKCIRYV
jgi:hypothetical protein